MWALLVLAPNLAGVTWVVLHLAVARHEVVAGAAVGVLAAAVLVANYRAARAAERTSGRPRMVREGHLWVREDLMRPREIRFTEQMDPPRPKLGAPGSPN